MSPSMPENAVRDDQSASIGACIFPDGRIESGFGHLCCVRNDTRTGETASINDGSMIEVVEKITSSLPTNADIVRFRCKTGLECNDIFGAFKFCESFFQLNVASGGTADRPYLLAGPTPYF